MDELQREFDNSMNKLQQKLNISMDELQRELGESKNELQQKLDTSMNKLQQKFEHFLKIAKNAQSNSRDKTLFYRRKYFLYERKLTLVFSAL